MPGNLSLLCWLFCKLFTKMAGTVSKVFLRNICGSRILQESLSEPFHPPMVPKHAPEWRIWRTLFFFVCCPIMLAGAINTMLTEEKPRPEFVRYSYLRIRNKKYPWRDGNKTLFHNPHRNALPDGYEDEH